MKKLLLSTLTLVLIFSLAGWATETRVLTLGDANNIVKDEANILLYPSLINMYKNVVLGEVDGGGFYRLGAHYDFGEDKCVVGLYLDRRGLGIEPGIMPDPGGDGMVDNRLNLFYGRPFGETYFGMAFSLYSESHTTDADDREEKNMDLGLQLGLTMLEEKLDLTAGFTYGTWTWADSAGDDVTEPETNMSINLGGRYWYEFNDEVNFVPHLGFRYDMGGYTDSPTDATYKMNAMMFDLGWGANIMPDDHVLLLFDFGIMYQSTTYENGADITDTEMNLPYFKVGLEGYVTKWWDIRMGAVKRWVSESYEDADKWGYTSMYSNDELSPYLGTGLHFGPLDIDIYMNDQFALNGPYFVSGNYTQLAYMTSIKYNLP